MSIAGLILVALCAVICVYLVPYLVRRRAAILSSREGDRFSPHLRVLEDTIEPVSARREGHPPVQLLASRERGGEALDAIRKPVAPSVAARRIEAREIAALRSQRASRLSAEAAASKRRFLAFIAVVVLFLAFAGFSLAGTISPWWLLLPGTLLVANVGVSRYAAVQTERANERYRKRMEELAEARLAQKPAQTLSEKIPTPKENDVRVDAVAVADTAVESSELVEVESGVAPAQEMDRAAGDTTTRDTESRQWEVSALPEPTYLRKEKVARRSIHVDTDIKGVPMVQGAIPARPVAASPLPHEEVPATFSFDLNAVLEARRAQ